MGENTSSGPFDDEVEERWRGLVPGMTGQECRLEEQSAAWCIVDINSWSFFQVDGEFISCTVTTYPQLHHSQSWMIGVNIFDAVFLWGKKCLL